MPSKYVKQKNFERNTNLIEAFCDENKIQYTKLNNGYQIRLEEMIDLYPVRGRWHNIKTGERGDWMGYKDLRRVMLAALEMINKPEVAPENTYKLNKPQGEVGKLEGVTVDRIQMQNKRGEWVPSIPLPFYGVKKKCSCGKSFWKEENYRAHYAYEHIVMGEYSI